MRHVIILIRMSGVPRNAHFKHFKIRCVVACCLRAPGYCPSQWWLTYSIMWLKGFPVTIRHTEFNPHRVYDNSSVSLWVYMRFRTPEHKNYTHKRYIASARPQLQICTHGCWNWHLCIPDGLLVVQCSIGHIIEIVYFDTILAWSEWAGQLSAVGVASVRSSRVQPPPGPRQFIGSFVGLYSFLSARASQLSQ